MSERGDTYRQAADDMPGISVDFADAEDAREWLRARAGGGDR